MHVHLWDASACPHGHAVTQQLQVHVALEAALVPAVNDHPLPLTSQCPIPRPYPLASRGQRAAAGRAKEWNTQDPTTLITIAGTRLSCATAPTPLTTAGGTGLQCTITHKGACHDSNHKSVATPCDGARSPIPSGGGSATGCCTMSPGPGHRRWWTEGLWALGCSSRSEEGVRGPRIASMVTGKPGICAPFGSHRGPTERSDPTQHAAGRTGDCPGPMPIGRLCGEHQ